MGARRRGAVFACYDRDIVWDLKQAPGVDFAELYHGHEGVRQFFRDWLEPFESYYAHAEQFIDAGESGVLVQAVQGGQGKGSGMKIEMPHYWQLHRLRDGLVVRVEVIAEEEDAFEAAGLSE